MMVVVVEVQAAKAQTILHAYLQVAEELVQDLILGQQVWPMNFKATKADMVLFT
jgi:hypothetical protein